MVAHALCLAFALCILCAAEASAAGYSKQRAQLEYEVHLLRKDALQKIGWGWGMFGVAFIGQVGLGVFAVIWSTQTPLHPALMAAIYGSFIPVIGPVLFGIAAIAGSQFGGLPTALLALGLAATQAVGGVLAVLGHRKLQRVHALLQKHRISWAPSLAPGFAGASVGGVF